jgi:hypothetical protein
MLLPASAFNPSDHPRNQKGEFAGKGGKGGQGTRTPAVKSAGAKPAGAAEASAQPDANHPGGKDLAAMAQSEPC